MTYNDVVFSWDFVLHPNDLCMQHKVKIRKYPALILLQNFFHPSSPIQNKKFETEPSQSAIWSQMKVNSKMVDDKVPERFELLGQTIEQFVETTRQIGIIVSDFQHGSQGVLNQKM